MLTMLLLLALAIGANALGGRWFAAAALAAVLAAWAMTRLPDLDLALGLGHRSAMTHSLLPVGLACVRRQWRPLAAGLAFGLGLHLSADLFPNAMRGYATIKLPLLGTIGAGPSYLWLAANAAAALALGAWLLRRAMPAKAAFAALVAIAVVGLLYLLAADGGWWALAMLGGAGGLAFRRRAAQPG